MSAVEQLYWRWRWYVMFLCFTNFLRYSFIRVIPRPAVASRWCHFMAYLMALPKVSEEG